jgi:hypothetical protein
MHIRIAIKISEVCLRVHYVARGLTLKKTNVKFWTLWRGVHLQNLLVAQLVKNILNCKLI